MRPTERLDLVDRIGRELQERYSYTDIDLFLSAFDVAAPTEVTINSKWIYSKEALKLASEETIASIAAELGIQGYNKLEKTTGLPRAWENTEGLKLFLSHLAVHKDKAIRLKEELHDYGISTFVAHEDIRPTLEWQREIEKALFSMDAMLSLHTKGFSESYWTQQEVGIAIGLGTKIISLRMGEDPTGFISKHQALSRGTKNATEVAREIVELLRNDKATKDKLV